MILTEQNIKVVSFFSRALLHEEELPDNVATALLLADLEVEVGEGNNHDETESNPKPFCDLKKPLNLKNGSNRHWRRKLGEEEECNP